MNQKTTTLPEHVTPATSPKGDPPAPPQPPKRGSGRVWVWLVLLIGAAAAAYYYWPKGSPAEAGTTPSKGGGSGKKGGGRGGLAPVVPVKATRGNIGVYIDAPGLIVPLNTVTVKTRVDGQLMQVNYKEGDLVQKDQPLVEIDPRPYQVALEQAEGQKARDEALLNNARVDQARYQTLLSQNAIPEQTLATQKALVLQYEGTVKMDQGLIDNAKLNITYCHITAPITGKIGLRLVDPGNIVHAADTNGLLVITQMEPISAIFPVPEDQLPPVVKRFHAGEKLSVEAWDRDGVKKLSVGTLTTMDNQIDPTTATLKLRATFNNSDNALIPNQFVRNRLLVQDKRNVILLPTAAIQLSNSNKYVWLLNADNTVAVRNVTTGTVEGDQTEITSGLDAGENVIMTGVDKLTEGAKVTVGGGGGRGGNRGGNAQAPGSEAPTDVAPSGYTGGSKQGGKRGGKRGGQNQ